MNINSVNSKLIIVIAGPTASGKSDLAVQLALWLARPAQQKRFGIRGAEIISADSRQVYKGLDIGSGKITKKEMEGIPHHMLGVASPKRVFSVAKYQKIAKRALEGILTRSKIPIICGGTGFYIDALINGTSFPHVAPNKKLRKKLQGLSLHELFLFLNKLDPVRAESIDRHNPVRLLRAIEIATSLGKVPTSKFQPLPFKVLYFGITRVPEELKKRIKKRLHKRMRLGMIQEAQNLHALGLSWKRLESLGLENRSISLFLRNRTTQEQMIKQIQRESWLYAKRQMTWWNKNKELTWVNGSSDMKNLLIKAKTYLTNPDITQSL